MANGCCPCRKDCTLWARIISLVVGIVTAFLQITAVIAFPAGVPAGAFLLAAVYLATVLVVAVLLREQYESCCLCPAIRAVLAGILVTALAAAALLVVSFAAASIVGALFTGLLAAGLAMTLSGTVCLVKCLTGCNE